MNLSNLTGLVEIKQEEIDLINQNLPVTFKPRQATVNQYPAKIADIQPVIQSDESGQNSVLQIRITIDNNDRQLQPGLEGVAHIQTPKLRVYPSSLTGSFEVIPLVETVTDILLFCSICGFSCSRREYLSAI